MTNIKSNTQNIVVSTLGLVIALSVVLFGFVTSSAHAASSYAYVDSFGDVRSVIANDWMTAINTAPNIHIHSGVLLLKNASDFTIIGDNVSAF